jgi:hypothetical protein
MFFEHYNDKIFEIRFSLSMRAYREIRGIAPLILNFDTRWR